MITSIPPRTPSVAKLSLAATALAISAAASPLTQHRVLTLAAASRMNADKKPPFEPQPETVTVPKMHRVKFQTACNRAHLTWKQEGESDSTVTFSCVLRTKYEKSRFWNMVRTEGFLEGVED